MCVEWLKGYCRTNYRIHIADIIVHSAVCVNETVNRPGEPLITYLETILAYKMQRVCILWGILLVCSCLQHLHGC
jgi:hypothetical protein